MIGLELEMMLVEKGFDNGWAIADGKLVLWEHDADPPAPLTRPEASDDLES
jgi:hypothetical protein